MKLSVSGLMDAGRLPSSTATSKLFLELEMPNLPFLNLPSKLD